MRLSCRVSPSHHDIVYYVFRLFDQNYTGAERRLLVQPNRYQLGQIWLSKYSKCKVEYLYSIMSLRGPLHGETQTGLSFRPARVHVGVWSKS